MAITKVVLRVICLVVLAGATSLRADVPHVFESGKPALAKEMNENFAAIDNTPPEITVGPLEFSDTYAMYSGVISIQDANDIFRVQFQTADFYADTEALQTVLGENGVIEGGPRVTEFWPAPGTKTLTLPQSLFFRYTEGPLMVIAQDVAGNLGRLAITIPEWPGGMIKQGTYQLDAPILEAPWSEATESCWASVGRLTGPGFPAEAGRWDFTHIRYQLDSLPNPVRAHIQDYNDGWTVSGCQILTTTSEAEYQCEQDGVKTSTMVDGILYGYGELNSYTYLSETTINVKRSYYCGLCTDLGQNYYDCSVEALSSPSVLTQESTATWITRESTQ